MIVSAEIRRRYDEFIAHAEVLRRIVRESLEQFCEQSHYALVDRIKTVASVSEKLESGRVKSWDELDDVYAATIVVPSLRDEATVICELERRFTKIRLKSRASTRTPPDVFRFDCPRFIGRLLPSPERESSPVSELLFEVQVRTAFEHAWSITTHALTYKADFIDWRRHRLTAALRASVEQIDLAIAGFERTAEEVLPGVWDESEAKRKVLARFKSFVDDGLIPSEMQPAAWSRFVDNVFVLAQAEASRRSTTKNKVKANAVFLEFCDAFEAWLRSIALASFPRSLSLFQTVFGVLASRKTLGSGLEFVVFGVADIVSVFEDAAGVALEPT